MPNAPEAEHLQRAVEAVKKGLLPERKEYPPKELAPEEVEEDRERQRESS